MAEQYTPTTQDVKRAWMSPVRSAKSTRVVASEFDRWLASHDAQVRAEALREAAESYAYVHAVSRLHSFVYNWLRARADGIADTNQRDGSGS